MNRKNSQSLPIVNQSNLATLQSLAEIYLSSAERLTALNLNSTRGMIEDAVAASMRQPVKEKESSFSFPQIAFVQPSSEKLIAYSRSAYEIVLESQQEIIRTLTSSISNMNGNFKLPTDWTAPFEMFSKGLQEASTLTQKNVASATEATQRTVSGAISKMEKVAS